MKLAFFKVGEIQGPLRHVNALLEYLQGRGVEVRTIELDPQNVQKAVEELQEFRTTSRRRWKNSRNSGPPSQWI